MKVKDLTPGDIVENQPFGRGICITVTDHPLYRDLKLVIWVMLDGKDTIHFDALSNEQDIGIYDCTDLERLRNIFQGPHGLI